MRQPCKVCGTVHLCVICGYRYVDDTLHICRVCAAEHKRQMQEAYALAKEIGWDNMMRAMRKNAGY